MDSVEEPKIELAETEQASQDIEVSVEVVDTPSCEDSIPAVDNTTEEGDQSAVVCDDSNEPEGNTGDAEEVEENRENKTEEEETNDKETLEVEPVAEAEVEPVAEAEVEPVAEAEVEPVDDVEGKEEEAADTKNVEESEKIEDLQTADAKVEEVVENFEIEQDCVEQDVSELQPLATADMTEVLMMPDNDQENDLMRSPSPDIEEHEEFDTNANLPSANDADIEASTSEMQEPEEDSPMVQVEASQPEPSPKPAEEEEPKEDEPLSSPVEAEPSPKPAEEEEPKEDEPLSSPVEAEPSPKLDEEEPEPQKKEESPIPPTVQESPPKRGEIINRDGGTIHKVGRKPFSRIQEEGDPSVDKEWHLDIRGIADNYAGSGDESADIIDDICVVCDKKVYQMEKLIADKVVYHKTCFKCDKCKRTLSTGNFARNNDTLYCKPHFIELFRIRGHYDERRLVVPVGGVQKLPDNKDTEASNNREQEERTASEPIRASDNFADGIKEVQQLANLRCRFEGDNPAEDPVRSGVPTEGDDSLPTRDYTKNILAKFREIEANGSSNDRQGREFSRSPDTDMPPQNTAKSMAAVFQAMGQQESSPAPENTGRAYKSGGTVTARYPVGDNVADDSSENSPQIRSDVIRSDESDTKEELPEEGTTRNLLARFKALQTSA